MADEQVQTTTQETEVVTQQNVQDMLISSLLGEQPKKASVIERQAPVVEAPQVTTETKAVAEETQEETFDESDYLQKQFNWKSREEALAELNELRELKSKPKTDFNFANEESKKLYELVKEGKTKEVRQYLETQEKINDLTAAEVSRDTAAEIIKLNMQLKYPNLTQSEIDYKFNKDFGLPKAPIKGELEYDDDFAIRKSEYDERVQDIEMSRVIEAKLAKPEIEKLKAEIVLPDINKDVQQQQQLSQKDLEELRAMQDNFIQSVPTTVNGFNGFGVTYKDKDVEYTVNYTPSIEEKTLLTNELTRFAKSGFDANVILAERWVGEDGKTLKVEQMIKDLSRIYAEDKLNQKLVTDASNKRLEAFLKEKKQINVNGNTTQGVFQPKEPKSEQEAVTDAWLALR